jgi:hypothetical protein
MFTQRAVYRVSLCLARRHHFFLDPLSKFGG